MSVPPAAVRPATEADATAIAELLDQLGYPATVEEVVDRLRLLRELPTAVILVADRGGRLVGAATGHVFPSIHSSAPAAWLTTLVVDRDNLKAGIGRLLVGAVEDWARPHGAVRISVTSGKHRDGAHAFYERIGYERTGVRLTKALR